MLPMNPGFEPIQTLLAAWSEEFSTPDPERLDVNLAAEHLRPVVAALKAAGWDYLSAITGLDLGAEQGGLEVLYHFCQGALVLTLRIRLPYENARLDSLDQLIPVASLYERELKEMYGIEMVELHDQSHLFLPDGWPQDVYPLRKDFDPAVLEGKTMIMTEGDDQ